MNKFAKLAAVAAAGALVLSGCAANEEPTDTPTDGGGELSGELQGVGASSMKAAQEKWLADFAGEYPDVQATYAPEGSGAGRKAFQGGGADFAGSDEAFKADENKAGEFAACAEGSIAYEMPVYISPVAVIFNVEGVDSLNMNAELIAKIFDGKVTKWNDPAIAELNPDAELPDADIKPVHRSDESGTTENFTSYLNEIAPEAWPHEPDKVWPSGGEGAKGTSGVVDAVTNNPNTIGYADASQAGDLAMAMVGENDNFSELTPEAAAQIVENSPMEEGREEHDLAIDLKRDGEGYPIVLVSYAIACAEYQDPAKAELVKAYLSYITSEEGQQSAAEAAGSAPLSEALTEQVTAAIDAIK